MEVKNGEDGDEKEMEMEWDTCFESGSKKWWQIICLSPVTTLDIQKVLILDSFQTTVSDR